MDDPPPPASLRYSLPLAMAEFNCPSCERTFRFVSMDGREKMDGQLLACPTCGAVVGRYMLGFGGWLLLEVVALAKG